MANEGGGAGVFDAVVAGTALLRSLVGVPASGSTVTQNATTITVENTLTGNNVGTGTGGVFRDKSGGAMNFRTLLDGTGGIAITQNADDITVENTLTASNVGTVGLNTGQVFVSKIGVTLGFRSLVALSGSNLTVAQVGADVRVANPGAGTSATLANVALGVGIHAPTFGAFITPDYGSVTTAVGPPYNVQVPTGGPYLVSWSGFVLNDTVGANLRVSFMVAGAIVQPPIVEVADISPLANNRYPFCVSALVSMTALASLVPVIEVLGAPTLIDVLASFSVVRMPV